MLRIFARERSLATGATTRTLGVMPNEKFPARVPMKSLLRRVLTGAAVAALLGLAWPVVAAKSALPSAGGSIVRLLTIAALGGAVGGVVFHYLEPLRQQSRGWKITANVAGALGYGVIVAVALALGSSAAH
ncbi:MAG: hypothetical protein C0518_11865 [Opitutus sp.]|nr:hypothetical protein [Opitutus sp.]